MKNKAAATSRDLRDSRVWKLSLSDEEKAFLDHFVQVMDTNLRQVIDDALERCLSGELNLIESEFVLTSSGGKRCSVRVDSELFESALKQTEDRLPARFGSAINAASLLATALWGHIDQVAPAVLHKDLKLIRQSQLRIRLR
jgi:hypothetical protein